MNTKHHRTINCSGTLVDLSKPKIMGILNLTPDSFFDGGNYNKVDAALVQCEKMIKEGADFIDVGAYSSKPGTEEVSEVDELVLRHKAISRQGFALGAFQALNWLLEKGSGVYTMNDMITEIR